MNATVDELAALVGGEVTGRDGSTRITGVAGISDATSGQITFFANRKYLADLKECKASAVLVPADFCGGYSSQSSSRLPTRRLLLP